jgi:DNA-binding protein H-NS
MPDAPAAALLTGLGAGEWSALRSPAHARSFDPAGESQPIHPAPPPRADVKVKALRALRDLDAAGRERRTGGAGSEGMPFASPRECGGSRTPRRDAIPYYPASPFVPAISCAPGYFICSRSHIYARLRINWKEEPMQLKSMSLDKLIALRSRVEATLTSKVADERRTLESELSKLTRFQGGGGARSKLGARGAVAPKYRNPKNPSETWAGRGLKPRWLAIAIKSGKKQDDFLIAGAAPTKKANGSKKARKTRK